MAKATRVAEKERFWRSMVEAQRRGGLTVRAFCRERGISEPSFYSWRKELQRREETRRSGGGAAGGRGVAAGQGEGRLIPVEVVGGGYKVPGEREGRPTNGRLEIATPGGFRLRFGRDTCPETVLCLLEAIGRCTPEGAASC